MEKIASSTLLIYVFDVNTMSLEDVKNDLESLISSGDKMLLVANKIDTPEGGKLLANFFELEPDAYISSLQKTNIEELKTFMYKKIVTDDLNIGNIIVTNARHLEALQKTRTSLDEVLNAINSEISGELTALHIRYALNALGEITGEITNDDLLDDIFRNFCIGK